MGGRTFCIPAFSDELATKLVDHQVLFYTGAGLSVNWGVPLGGAVAKQLKERFQELHPETEKNEQIHTLLKDIKDWDLPLVSEFLGQNKCWYIRELIVPDVTHPPARSPLGLSREEMLRTDPVRGDRIGIPHLVLARLAKEGLITELMTTNVDTLHEAACEAVGMVRLDTPRTDPSLDFPWLEAYRVVADRTNHAQLWPERNLFTIHKIHGCVDAVRHAVRQQTAHECAWNHETDDCHSLSQSQQNFVFTYRELLNWRTDHWARDLLADRVRNHHVVFSGFAVADSVSHATFREVFDEVVDKPSRAKLGSNQGEQGNGYTRAQMISKELNVQAAAVLLSANQRDPLGDKRHVAETGGSREDLEALFQATYARAMTKLLDRQINLRGPGILSHWLPAESGETADEHIHKAAKGIRDYLKDLVNTPEFLYGALPAAVRLAWLSTDKLIQWGIPAREGMQRSPYTPRFTLPNYYVPLSCELEITMLMLQAYRVLLNEQLPGQAADVTPNGWVRFPATATTPARAVLPVLAPSRENLPMLARVRGFEPPPRVAAGLLVLTPNQGAGGLPPQLSTFPHVSLGAFASMKIDPVSCSGLWSPDVKASIHASIDAPTLQWPRR